MKHFKDGQIVAYIPLGANDMFYKVEVGKIKRIDGDYAFVYFHSGDTTAKTLLRDLYPIENDYYLKDALLGVGGLV